MKITILKPDHLGDIVLSSPAVNKLLSLNYDLTLLVNKNSDFLIRHLFPKVKIDTVTFSHLSRSNEGNDFDAVFKHFSESDLFISLRNDPQLEALIFNKIDRSKCLIVENSLFNHETNLQALCIKPAVGDYDPLDFFYTFKDQNKKWPNQIDQVGLVISAGFFNNSLTPFRWLEFANFFIRHHKSQITIVCGPNEKQEAQLLKGLIGQATIIEGSKNLPQFLEDLSNLDLMVATDSGSAHLASLAGVPILSLFGASPAARFRPIGRYNKVISLDFNCSPCPQFEVRKINHCITKECLSNIQVKHIANSL